MEEEGTQTPRQVNRMASSSETAKMKARVVTELRRSSRSQAWRGPKRRPSQAVATVAGRWMSMGTGRVTAARRHCPRLLHQALPTSPSEMDTPRFRPNRLHSANSTRPALPPFSLAAQASAPQHFPQSRTACSRVQKGRQKSRGEICSILAREKWGFLRGERRQCVWKRKVSPWLARPVCLRTYIQRHSPAPATAVRHPSSPQPPHERERDAPLTPGHHRVCPQPEPSPPTAAKDNQTDL